VELGKELDELMETMDRKQKILATIICVPGEKTYVADWMNTTFSIILDADPSTILETASGLKITKIKDFPSGKKCHDAFQPLHSDNTKILKLVFHLTTAPSLQKIKSTDTLLTTYESIRFTLTNHTRDPTQNR
jgi:hypothetical protein